MHYWDLANKALRILATEKAFDCHMGLGRVQSEQVLWLRPTQTGMWESIGLQRHLATLRECQGTPQPRPKDQGVEPGDHAFIPNPDTET